MKLGESERKKHVVKDGAFCHGKDYRDSCHDSDLIMGFMGSFGVLLVEEL